MHLNAAVLFTFIITVLHVAPLINSAKLKSGIESESSKERRGIEFFNSLAFLDFGIQDITAMLKNAAAEEQTEGCSGMCRTPIAFWMLQPLFECNQVLKADCPAGLVCCSSADETETRKTLRQQSDNYFRAQGTPFDYQIPEEDLEILKMLKTNKTKSTLSLPNVQNKTSL